MTAVVERVLDAPVRHSLCLALAAPALILLTLIAQFLRSHGYDLLRPESLILLAMFAVSGIVIGALTRLRPVTLEPLFLSLLLVAFIFSRPELSDPLWAVAVKLRAATGHMAAAFSVFLALAVGILILGWLLRRHLSAIVSAAFGAMLISTILLPDGVSGRPIQTGSLPSVLNDLPPVVHIILDEHIGLAGVPGDIDGSSVVDKTLRSTYEDFALYSHAYSRYAETSYALGSMMNGEGDRDFAGLLTEHQNGHRYRLERNAWFEQLRARGYAVSVYQSSWLDMCATADVCYTYPFTLSPIQRSSLGTLQRVRVLLREFSPFHAWPQTTALASTEAMLKFEEDFAQVPGGVAYVVHLLLPHYMYVYQEDCSLVDPAEWQNRGAGGKTQNTAEGRRLRYSMYFDQLTCTAQQVRGILTLLKAHGFYDDASIIIHSDHGSRIAENDFRGEMNLLSEQDLVDHFSTLLAVKTPASEAGVNSTPIAIQDFFAKVFLGIPPREDLANHVFIRQPETSMGARELRWPAPGARPTEVRAQP